MKKFIIRAIVATACVFIAARYCTGNSCCSQQSACQSTKPMLKPFDKAPVSTNSDKTKKIIQEAYSNVVKEGGLCTIGGGCCGGGADLSQLIGYSADEINKLADANLGLGCGYPVGLADIKPGDIVLDLGSGAGFDCFLAAKKTGAQGKIIGIDMTQLMIEKARDNAKQYNFSNVEFRLGDIETLPVESNSIDIVISNCVINLAPNKGKVFAEAYRVLKTGGKMVVSDVVLTQNLTREQQQDEKLLSACVSGAILKQDYIHLLTKTGFGVTIVDEDNEIGPKWFGFNDLPIVSLKFIAYKK